ncbi:CoA ester lyase [Arthrobacter sp. 18067]|uniref:HpcH/HpaI aldolase/citrate lyase family protein n=1 Tax=Arthrobacter sp. 18067 TaxID=2681413 RepID=UPI001358540C|nr:aldolase/citrate lyase family protein [Arthrobacter sp. 18067]
MFVRNTRAANLPANLSRSWLLASASRECDLHAALASEADSVVFDLEDGVPEAGKAAARERVAVALDNGAQAWVRINTEGTKDWAADLEAVAGQPGLRGVMLAMTEEPHQVVQTSLQLPSKTPVIALVETALGVDNASAIARAPGTFRLAFGIGDFRRDTGASDDAMALAYARGRLVVASRAAGLPGPIDGPTVDAKGRDLETACRTTLSMGMTGKLCLAAGTSPTINAALAPSSADIAWAASVLKTHSRGRTDSIDGSYLPMLARARRISDLASSYYP